MSSEPRSDIKLAASPFDDELKADVILRSSDGVHFYAHKIILSIASSFFRDMFSLPEPDSSRRQTVDMTEDSSTLDALLRLCYPVRDPPFNDWSPAVNILLAATKYQMDEATELVTNSIKTFIPSTPLAVYGLACHPNINSEGLASLAAQEWMKQKPEWVSLYSREYRYPYYFKMPEWEKTSISESYDSQYAQSTTAGQWYRLLRSLRTKELPDKFLVNKDLVQGIPMKPRERPATDYYDRLSHGDIIIRSIDGYDFCTYKIILQMASPKLLKCVMDGGRTKGSELSAIPTYPLSEHGSTIQKVLDICDPSATEVSIDVGDLDLWQNLLQMALKYDIPKAVSTGKLWCTCLIKENPLRSYYIAIRYGWEELAKQSARATLFASLENAYTPEMEHVSAKSYYNLMKYHQDFQRDFSTTLIRFSPTNISPQTCSTLFSIWKVKDVEDHSFSMQWNDELAAVLSFATRISLNRSNYSDDDFTHTSNTFIAELKEKMNAIKLEI